MEIGMLKLRLFFVIFSKTTFRTYVVYDLNGSIVYDRSL